MSARKQVVTCPNPRCGAVLPSLLATCREDECLAEDIRVEAAHKRREDQ